MLSHEITALYRAIGEGIRRKRLEASISQAQLSRKIGLSRVSIVNIESGRQHAPLNVLWDIALVLRFELKDLIPLNAGVIVETIERTPEEMKSLGPKDRSTIEVLWNRLNPDNNGGQNG